MNAPATTSGVPPKPSIKDLVMEAILKHGTVTKSTLITAYPEVNEKSFPPALSELFMLGHVVREKVNSVFVYQIGPTHYSFGGNGKASPKTSNRRGGDKQHDVLLITLQVQGRKVECNLEEARRIYTQLGRLFGVRSNGD